MKNPAQEYRFKIDAFTPDTIPMARLAEYLTDLAALLGHQHSVHFVRMEEGSTVLVHSVEYEDVPKVQQRLIAVVAQEGPPDAMKAFAALDQKLAKDNAVGKLQGYNDNDIIRFPGRERPEPFVYGPVKQQGSIDGVLIRIGGKDETVPVHLESENIIYQCNTSRQMASQLAHNLFGPVLRVHGSGRWQREEDGTWTMLRFNISHFEVLDDSPLTEAVKRLRAIEGSDWKTLEDPFAELDRIRHEPDEIH
jgi:hypothetical protein